MKYTQQQAKQMHELLKRCSDSYDYVFDNYTSHLQDETEDLLEQLESKDE